MPTRSGQRQQWRANYEAISRAILQGQLPPGVQHNNSHEHMGSMSSSDYSALRRKQVTDLVNIEKNYESLLLSETRFPKADETNGEVRSWVELAMENRRILCGSSWSDEELGPGGKNAVGRRTLDVSNEDGLIRAKLILYRSSTVPQPRLSTRRRFYGISSPSTPSLGNFTSPSRHSIHTLRS